MRLVLLFITFFSLISTAEAGIETITIDAAVTVATPHALGINANYLLDSSLDAATLIQLGAGVLRYPGGEKSDTYLWDAGAVTLNRTGPNEWPAGDGALVNPDGSFVRPPLGFDAYLALCEANGIEPIVVVAFDSAFQEARPPGTAPTFEELREHAAAMVRYAAGRVTYWEIGNESYLGGWNGAPSAAQYADGVLAFGLAMKAEDATIQIGANGSDAAWWNTVLDHAGSVVDFLSVHNYPVWGFASYSAYRSDSRTLIYAVESAAAVLSARGDSTRWIAVTEMGALTWNSWPAVNDLGHAILLADMLTQQLEHPKVRLHLLWTTRWQAWNWPAADTLPEALDASGGLRPSGHVLSLFAGALGDRVVRSTNSTKVHSLASMHAGDLTIVLVNKDTNARSIAVQVRGYVATSATREDLRGSGAGDVSPIRSMRPSVAVASGKIALTLPATSITVLRLKGQAT